MDISFPSSLDGESAEFLLSEAASAVDGAINRRLGRTLVATDEDRLLKVLERARFSGRICPIPMKWQEFWSDIGSPEDLPPLVLAGYAFSTDRQKQERFQEHIRYAANIGKLRAAEEFVDALTRTEWHSNLGGDLDWSYGDTILEEIEQRNGALRRAREHHARLIDLTEGNAAFDQLHLSQTLFHYELLYRPPPDTTSVEILRNAVENFCSLTSGNEISLLEDAPTVIASILQKIHLAKQIELLMLEILDCMKAAGVPMDRDSVDSFVEDMFIDPQ